MTSWSANAVAHTVGWIATGRSTPNAITSPLPLRVPTSTLSLVNA